MKKSHLELAKLSNDVYANHEYEVDGIEFSLIDNVWVFRGTDEVTDWLTNLRVIPWYVDRVGWCHSGFIKTAQDVFSTVLAVSLKEDCDETQFQYTGHSLGGAIALGVAAYIKLYGLELQNIVTFGAPCVGRLKILDQTDVVCYRHGRDIVPMLPLVIGRPRPLTNIGEPSSRRWNVADHDMDNYEASLSLI